MTALTLMLSHVFFRGLPSVAHLFTPSSSLASLWHHRSKTRIFIMTLLGDKEMRAA